MFKATSILTLSTALLLVSSCATTSTDSNPDVLTSPDLLTSPDVLTSLDVLISDGAKIFNLSDLIGVNGVTFVATDGRWSNYLGVDGRKVVKENKTGQINEFTWWINDAGQFCEKFVPNEKESCGNNVVVKETNGFYSNYNKQENKLGLPFTIVAGNPEGF